MASHNWDKPRCFIENCDKDGLKLNEETFKVLCDIKVPVYAISIVGLYRTGKSYLMNLLAGQTAGFDIGSTIEAKTKGIWIWCVKHPNIPDACLLLLDTEGLGDPDKGDKNHDVWIFVLAVLLSSTFVYNSMGTIDQRAIDELHFVTEMSEHVKVKATTREEDGEDFQALFPQFIWAVRDFILELVLDGEPCTSDDYLENALKLKPGCTPKVMQYNLPRQCLNKYFPERKCFTFPRPAKEDSDMRQLDKLAVSQLTPGFMECSEQFMNYVIQNTHVKSIEGNKLTCSAFANLAQCYVKAIQENAIPCIENAVTSMSKLENEKAVRESLEMYRALMNEEIKLPTEKLEELSTAHHKCESEAIAEFMRLSIFDQELIYQMQLANEIKEEYKSYCRQNELESEYISRDILYELYNSLVSDRLSNGDYATPGGYELYRIDMKNIEDVYYSTPGKGIMAYKVYSDFINEKQTERNSILAGDKKISAEQRKLEEQRREKEAAEMRENLTKEENEKLNQMMEDQKKSEAEHIRQLEMKLNEVEQEQKSGFFKKVGAVLDDILTAPFKVIKFFKK